MSAACPTERSRSGAAAGRHGERDALHHEARHGLAHDGLGPAHGVDGRGGRHHPVGPAQRGDRSQGQEVRLPGPHPDADQTTGDGRVGLDRRSGGRGAGQGDVEGVADEVGL